MFRPGKARNTPRSAQKAGNLCFRRSMRKTTLFCVKHACAEGRRPPARKRQQRLRAENETSSASARKSQQKRFRVRVDDTEAAFAGTPRQIPLPGPGRGSSTRFPSEDETGFASARKPRQVPLPTGRRRKARFPAGGGGLFAVRSAAERCPPRERKRVSGCACCLPTRGRLRAARAGR